MEKTILADIITLNRLFVRRPVLLEKIGMMNHYVKDFIAKTIRKGIQEAIEPCKTSLTAKEYSHIISEKERERSLKEIEILSAEGIQFVTIIDEEYPSLMKYCPDAPILIYVKSTTPAKDLFKQKCISIVGTRDMSTYGAYCIDEFVQSAKEKHPDVTLVSGLAIGSDARVHKAALKAGIKTIAVLPVGIDSIYPQQHKSLAERISSTPGCALITNFPPETTPLPINFLQRNRIIAGISQRTVISETKLKGGAMVTARLAYHYGSQVYAFPGRFDDVRSQGCNQLIGEGIAKILISKQNGHNQYQK